LNEIAPSIPLSVILVNYNTRDHTLVCLESLQANLKGLEHEIIVVDNASDDESVATIKQNFPEVKTLALAENVGFARANNLAAAAASGRSLLILNCDTQVPPGTIEHLMTVKEQHGDCGIVAPLILNGDSSFQLSFGKDLNLASEFFMKFISPKWHRILYKIKRERISRTVDWVSGACFLIEASLFHQLGGFDENFFIYIEDADLCRRVRLQNLQVLYTAEVHIIHYLGGSTSRHTSLVLPHAKRSQLYYYCKYHSRLSLSFLSFYLKLRFRTKVALSRLKQDKTSLAVFEKSLQAIEEFSCEADT